MTLIERTWLATVVEKNHCIARAFAIVCSSVTLLANVIYMDSIWSMHLHLGWSELVSLDSLIAVDFTQCICIFILLKQCLSIHPYMSRTASGPSKSLSLS